MGDCHVTIWSTWVGKTSYMHLAPEHVLILSNILEELSEVCSMHVPWPQLNLQKPVNVFEAMKHVLN